MYRIGVSSTSEEYIQYSFFSSPGRLALGRGSRLCARRQPCSVDDLAPGLQPQTASCAASFSRCLPLSVAPLVTSSPSQKKQQSIASIFVV
jgi:hypothetical protein